MCTNECVPLCTVLQLPLLHMCARMCVYSITAPSPSHVSTRVCVSVCVVYSWLSFTHVYKYVCICVYSVTAALLHMCAQMSVCLCLQCYSSLSITCVHMCVYSITAALHTCAQMSVCLCVQCYSSLSTRVHTCVCTVLQQLCFTHVHK